MTQEDLTSGPFSTSLQKCTSFTNVDIENEEDCQSKVQVLIHYEEVHDTGEKFLRVATRQFLDGAPKI